MIAMKIIQIIKRRIINRHRQGAVFFYCPLLKNADSGMCFPPDDLKKVKLVN